jgi:hypothetical protein
MMILFRKVKSDYGQELQRAARRFVGFMITVPTLVVVGATAPFAPVTLGLFVFGIMSALYFGISAICAAVGASFYTAYYKDLYRKEIAQNGKDECKKCRKLAQKNEELTKALLEISVD